MVAVHETRRAETAQRWARAFERALEHGLDVLVAADNGERFVSSASSLDTIHRCDGITCTCAAAVAGDPVCMHRAAVRYVLGTLPVVVVNVEDLPLESPASVACPSCTAGKVAVWGVSEIIGAEPCGRCQGSGRLDVAMVHVLAPDAPAWVVA